MGLFHFLNVKQGDCSIIQHPSGRVTMIDVNNASSAPEDVAAHFAAQERMVLAGTSGALVDQSQFPVNPIAYMRARGINSLFRFVVTHPDMDHMGGIKDLFEEFGPPNFWDTDIEEKKDGPFGYGHNRPDWTFYQRLHKGEGLFGTKRLVLNAGDTAQFWNQGPPYGSGDNLHILSPTRALTKHANETEDPNDGGYVILYVTPAGRILFCGDSHDETWAHLIANYSAWIRNVDLLIAPHHGRHSDRSFDFLKIVNPTMTFFGNAPTEHLAHANWRRRGLLVVSNKQANSMIVDTSGPLMKVFVTNGAYARSIDPNAQYSTVHGGWGAWTITPRRLAA
ncbi:MAG: MBL fold metallo-hydrolase [Alphaproteobacteria bacterium]|nr:MBL fold metallo-hydrolase [Alphaproteobacteria bacterium]